MNAFELISMSQGLNLGNLFDHNQVSYYQAVDYSISVLYCQSFTLTGI